MHQPRLASPMPGTLVVHAEEKRATKWRHVVAGVDNLSRTLCHLLPSWFPGGYSSYLKYSNSTPPAVALLLHSIWVTRRSTPFPSAAWEGMRHAERIRGQKHKEDALCQPMNTIVEPVTGSLWSTCPSRNMIRNWFNAHTAKGRTLNSASHLSWR